MFELGERRNLNNGVEGSAPFRSSLEGVGVSLSYGDGPILDDISLRLVPGEAVGVLGRSGSGKTSLLHVMAALLQPQGGVINLDGVRIDNLPENRRSRIRLRRFGFVFQFGELVPELTVAENVELPLILQGVSRKSARAACDRILSRLNIDRLGGRRPADISGGETQRAAVARALIHNPAVVFADEPTGALDDENRKTVLSLLLEAARELGASVLLATHDDDVAPSLERCFRLEAGRLVET